VQVLIINTNGIVEATSSAPCLVLNDDCGRLGERVYSGTSRTNPEVITFSESTVRFANGLSMKGAKLSFVPDVNPTNKTYLGVWRVKKGTEMYVRLRNLHPTAKTNLHTHGLHVKGTGEDDPTVEVLPLQEHLYRFRVGNDHRKSFWGTSTRMNEY